MDTQNTVQTADAMRSLVLSHKGLLGCGTEYTAALDAGGHLHFSGGNRWGQGEAIFWEGLVSVCCGPDYLLGLTREGRVLFAGRDAGEEDGTSIRQAAASLTGIRLLSCGPRHAAALSGSGRVSCMGENSHGQCDTEAWKNITDICCGDTFTLGLTRAGQVLVAGGSDALVHRVSGWQGVAGLFADAEGQTAYAVTGDGRLLSTGRLPGKARQWHGLVQVTAVGRKLWGVTAAGQLLSCDSLPPLPERYSGAYSQVAACAAGPYHTVIVTRDGRAVCLGTAAVKGKTAGQPRRGQESFGRGDVAGWPPLFDRFESISTRRLDGVRTIDLSERQYQERLTMARRYSRRLACGPRLTACLTADDRVLSTGGMADVRSWRQVIALSCGASHLLALRADGRVLAAGNDDTGCCLVSGWAHVRQILAGKYHSLGLREDGRVLFAGQNSHGQGDVTRWEHIVMLRGTDRCTVGVDKDGALHVAGRLPVDERAFRTIDGKRLADLCLTEHLVAALYTDGRVQVVGDATCVCTGPEESTGEGSDWVSLATVADWRDVRALAAGDSFLAGLCYGGHVVAAGRNDRGQCRVDGWHRVVAVACGACHAVGLCADGTVVSSGAQRTGEEHKAGTSTMGGAVMAWEKAAFTGYAPCDTSAWRDVLAVACGRDHTVAITAGGRLLTCGLDLDGQCTEAASFTLFRDLQQYDGYGRYHIRSESSTGFSSHAREDGIGTERDDLPFDATDWSTYAPALRRDAKIWVDHMAGDHAHMTCLDDRGGAFTYLFGQKTVIRERVEDMEGVATVSAGAGCSLFVYRDGRVRERADMAEGTPLLDPAARMNIPPAVAEGVMGSYHTVLLMTDGTVYASGDNGYGQCDTLSWRNIVQVATGSRHTVGLRSDGTVVATGGSEDAPFRRTGTGPCAVRGWKQVVRIYAGPGMTLGLCGDGTLRAAGNNRYGQCRTALWQGVVDAATSGKHTVGLRADGTVLATGCNDSGECDTASWTRVIQIAVTEDMTLGLRADGTVLAAGRHRRVFRSLQGVRSLACLGDWQVFLLMDGSLWLHRRGSDFLPEKLRGVRLFTPAPGHSILSRWDGPEAPVVSESVVARRIRRSFGCGLSHTARLLPDGRVATRGANDCGQCDTASWTGVTALSCGLNHTGAIADGRVQLTGWNTGGQCRAEVLNNQLIQNDEKNTMINSDIPAGAGYFTDIACGYEHTAVLRGDGRVFAIGANPDGRCDTHKWRNVIDIACGVRHTAAVTADGQCLATGDNGQGQCRVDGWSHVVMVACGEYHTVGLCADGHVVAVGGNSLGQCRVDDLQDIISIGCLPEATLCVHADGHVTVRGGDRHLVRATAGLQGVVAIDGKEYRLCALTVDRQMIMNAPGEDGTDRVRTAGL